ncbi:unnamed protein product [Bursaphelenchus xylophilus]|uniref:(pine wood nematode) hypothetical protein n=1 Tax=Bursaphelenchus xylophilus TaxID=6326 RepID=A0A1I7RIL1_BURXY|nr:unnamed protein product [Bursaphelenchus xylophilus]CAG9118862.1 unnamed protein product [Bursaphelenchus xylophilus]
MLDNVSNFTEYYDDIPMDAGDGEMSFLALLYLSYMPLCCLVGLTGNCMVYILIRTNQIFRRLPSSVYLQTLAGMSSLFLVSLLSFWVDQGFIQPSAQRSKYFCKVSTFLTHFCDFASVWLIVLVSFERLTLLYKATFRRSMTNSMRQVGVLITITFCCNLWILLVAEINEIGICDIKPEYEHIYHAFSLMETGICMIIPTVLIILFNVLVILKLRSHFKKIPASPSVSFNTADTVYSTGPSHTIKSMKISKASLHHLSVNGTNNAETIALRYKRCSLRYADLQLTRSLVIVTSVFILLNLPNYLYRIAVQYLKISDQSELMQRFSFAAHVLLYTHHACLFYMYIFNSPQMRRRLLPTALKLLECYCLKPVQDYSENGINY